MTTDKSVILDTGGLGHSEQATFGRLHTSWEVLRYVAVRQGGTFHAMPCRADGDEWQIYPQSWGYVYSPVRPSTTFEDVEGATYAYWDGKYFRFAHCSPDEQIDFAADARTFALDQFSIEIDEAHIKIAEATNAPVKAQAVTKAKALIAFTKAVGADVHKRVVGATLGHYHRLPHHDHRRELAIAGIDAVLEAWREAGITDKAIRLDRQNIVSTAAEVRAALTSEHDIEWRADRVKRLNDEAAARGTDPVDGHEYVYTLVPTTAAITDATKLPNPTWLFDNQPVGGYNRNGQRYYDSEPETTDELPHVIRFKRPVPADTKPGASIGSVAWTQEAAY